MKKVLAKIDRTLVVEKITSAIIEYIADQRLGEGQRLPTEEKLAEMLRASRLAVREALAGLKVLGVVRARQGSGLFVGEITPSTMFQRLSPLLRLTSSGDLHSIMQVRRLMEPEIAALAAETISGEMPAELRQSLDQMEAALGDVTVFVSHDMRFHALLAEHCGNRVLQIISALMQDLCRLAQFAYRDAREARERSLRYHRDLYGAIADGDPVTARQIMCEHMKNVSAGMEITKQAEPTP